MLFKLFCCFVSIFVSYLLNGIAIESITAAFGERIYTFYFTMVLIPSVFNLVVAKLMLKFTKPKVITDAENFHHTKPCVPQKYYILCTLFNIGSLLCSNASLAHINYPTQLILKSSKPIPILLCSCISPSNKYSSKRFVSVTIIVCGVMFFMYEQYLLNRTSLEKPNASADLFFGWFLVFCSLMCDGFLGAIQQHMKEHFIVYTFSLMYYINLYSVVLIGIPAVLSNNLLTFYLYVLQDYTIIVYLCLLGLSSGIGQMFIYYTIIEFGPLTCAVITTTRKFFNILISVLLFSHIMSMKTWVGVSIVFFGLALDIYIPYRN